MIAKYVQQGETMDYVAAKPINYGDVVNLGSRIGISGNAAPAGVACAVHVCGVFELPLADDEAADVAVGLVAGLAVGSAVGSVSGSVLSFAAAKEGAERRLSPPAPVSAQISETHRSLYRISPYHPPARLKSEPASKFLSISYRQIISVNPFKKLIYISGKGTFLD